MRTLQSTPSIVRDRGRASARRADLLHDRRDPQTTLISVINVSNLATGSQPGLCGHVKHYMSARSGHTAQISIPRGMPQRYKPVLCAGFSDMISTFFAINKHTGQV